MSCGKYRVCLYTRNLCRFDEKYVSVYIIGTFRGERFLKFLNLFPSAVFPWVELSPLQPLASDLFID